MGIVLERERDKVKSDTRDFKKKKNLEKKNEYKRIK